MCIRLLGFENEFTLEKHPHGNSPSQNVHLASGKTAGGTVVQQPQLSLLQTTVVGGSSDTTGSIRPAGTDNETATLKIKLTADYAKNMKIKLASLLPTGFTFKDVVSITKTSAKGEQTTYTPVQGTTQGNGIYMFGTEEELTVNTGDIVEITIYRNSSYSRTSSRKLKIVPVMQVTAEQLCVCRWCNQFNSRDKRKLKCG